jgi:hypothetical protein
VPPTLEVERAYSGSQMGRKAAFKDVLPKIDDDYLYRNEDIIFANLIKDAGFRYGKVAETSHDHQVMFKESRWLRRVKRASFELELSHEEEVRAARTYVYGIVKYLHPDRAEDLIQGLRDNLFRLEQLKELNPSEFAHWVAKTNPAWSQIFPIAAVESAASAALAYVEPVRPQVPPVSELSEVARVSDADCQTNQTAGARMPAVAGSALVPTHQPLSQYQPSMVGRTVIYLLSGADLALRGHVGPARSLRQNMQAGAAPPRVIETRPTLAAIKLVKYVDQVGCGQRPVSQVRSDVARALNRVAQIFGRNRQH